MDDTIDVKGKDEVWWATTNEYDLDVNGENFSVRIAETTKSTEFFVWNESTGWEEADTNEGVMAIVYEAWNNGEID
jgi:hypothetical protein|tara:strand:+ start:9104 stop:9331 length:228 start_codon:yes stop_codon:yes gene_type:complete